MWTDATDLTIVRDAKVLTVTNEHEARQLPLPGLWSAIAGQEVPWDTGVQLIDVDFHTHMLAGVRDDRIMLQVIPPLPIRCVTSRWLTLLPPDGTLAIYRR